MPLFNTVLPNILLVCSQSPPSPQESPTSRPLSLATNISVELGGYQAALEDVLTWLLEAEDRLNNAPACEGTLESIKEQFRTHEVQINSIYAVLKPHFVEVLGRRMSLLVWSFQSYYQLKFPDTRIT